MKKLLALLCALSLAMFSCPAALAAAPSLSAGDHCLTVKYENPSAQGNFTYMLLDAWENILLVEINAGGTWTPDWSEDGSYKIRVYYQDAEGKTRSEESDFTTVRFEKKNSPIDSYWPEGWDTGSTVTIQLKMPEYNDPTPAPLPTPTPVPSGPQLVDPVFTLPPSQGSPTSPPATVAVQPTAAGYPGTRPCFEHLNIRIRISDNDQHTASVGRSGPGTDMPQVATLNVGEVFQVLDCRVTDVGNVHWFMVLKNGVYCWVASGRCERY